MTAWGAAANLALSTFKMIAGLCGRSSAMVADAVHSLSDLVSDVVVLVLVRVAGRDRDEGHDYGHGKFETLATLIVSILLIVVGAKLMSNAVDRVGFVLSGGELGAPGRIALWAALASIAVKEALYRWTVAVGKKVNSSAVVANAWHHRSDALSSVGAALGIGCSVFFGGKWTVLDPLVGGIISVVIIVVAVKMALPAIGELTEASLPEEMECRITEIILSVKGVKGAHELKTRRNGRSIIIDVHIVVNPDLSVLVAHNISTDVEDSLREEFGQETQVSIHIEPEDDSQ